MTNGRFYYRTPGARSLCLWTAPLLRAWVSKIVTGWTRVNVRSFYLAAKLLAGTRRVCLAWLAGI
jgi:hypothetical protein